MVGTDPALGSATTVVPVAIIPVKFVFPDGRSLDGTPSVASVLASPIFQSFGYTSGTTQFGDAIMRAEFWSSVSTTSPDWHVLLAAPTVYPTQVFQVPAGQGIEITGANSGKLLAELDANWYSDRVFEAINKLKVPATSLVIFHSYNVLGTSHNGGGLFIGYHFETQNADGNGNQGVQTGIVETWLGHGILSRFREGVEVLSHETSEWLHNPFGGNRTPPWEYAGGLGICQDNLETGDYISVLPNVNDQLPITLNGFTYYLQNEALLPWFSREVPSSAIGGAYSYPDTTILTSPSLPALAGQICPPK
jgi:hypothetical protein